MIMSCVNYLKNKTMRKFEENQYITPMIKYFILLSTLGIMTYAFVASSETFAENLIPMVLTFITYIAAMFLVFYLRLKLSITKDKIEYRLYPIEFKTKTIQKEDIASIKIGKQNFFEFGGLGKRRGIFKRRIGYLMNKKYKLEVLLKNGKQIVFSIEDEKELSRFTEQNYKELKI